VLSICDLCFCTLLSLSSSSVVTAAFGAFDPSSNLGRAITWLLFSVFSWFVLVVVLYLLNAFDELFASFCYLWSC
jgi:hypothetical protein